MRKLLFRKLIFIFTLLLTHNPLNAQVLPQSRPAEGIELNVYAITNAQIVTGTGTTIEKGSIIIRDGLISGVGAEVNIPADARIIDGSGLTIYPGLIDAYTNLGFPAPITPATAAARGGAPPPNPALLALQQAPPAITARSTSTAFHPEILAADRMRVEENQLEAIRGAGLTSVLSVPRDGIFIGQSAFVNLVDGSTYEMVLKSPVAMHVSFNFPRSGGYPSSLMGVFSLFRQKLLDAQNYRETLGIYQRNSKGVRRPDYDPQLAALLPILAREIPIIFSANSEREINRALDLAEEFNLRAIIGGGADSWKVIDRLRARNVPVLLSLNYPKRTTEALPEADPESFEILRSRVNAPKTAGRLAAAGIKFAFQSGGLTNINDYLVNATKAVEAGLSADQAVRGMTLSAAEILGLDQQLGTIEAGKIANLTVIRGDIFNKSRKITELFIDGKQIELKSIPPTIPEAARPTAPTN